MIISDEELRSFVDIKNAKPHDRLGMHLLPTNREVVVRAFLDDAEEVYVINSESREKFLMEKVHPKGFFEAKIKSSRIFEYSFQVETFTGEKREKRDPYSFLPSISEYDCYLINQGKHFEIYNKLGAHILQVGEVLGTSFCVWAPNAQRISVVGDFNNWDGHYHPMRMIGASGIWELFIPDNLKGEKYKYEILGADGEIRLKSDPYSHYYEPPFNNASVVWPLGDDFSWSDKIWQSEKGDCRDRAMSVYEVHIDSWRKVVEDNNRPLNYKELAVLLCQYVKEMGFTHVEFLPISEHPFLGSWGYQVTGFFAPTHRYGPPEDFMYLVDYLHQNNIGVILDWVPAHFPRDAFALEFFDGTHLYEHGDPRQGVHNDWGTLIFNYGRHEVRNFLIGSALFWFDKFHIDGIRIDAVASMLYLDYSRKPGEWIPNCYGGHENIEAIEFLRELNNIIHEKYPTAVTIAEESTAFGGVTRPTKYHGLGFDIKWNMGWMHDTLSYFSKPTIYRKYHHNQLTFGMLYQNSEKFLLPMSHDEVVHGKSSLIGKMPGLDMREKAKNLKLLYAFMWGWPGKKLLFMGSEFGQSREWNYAESLDWNLLQYTDHQGVQRVVKDLNQCYQQYVFLGQTDFDPNGFEWAVVDDSHNSVVAFFRKGTRGEIILVICNFTPVVRENYRVGVSKEGYWREILNTDSDCYGGEGIGNMGGKKTETIFCHNKPFSLSLTLPKLGAIFLSYEA